MEKNDKNRKEKIMFIEDYVKNLDLEDAILPLDSRASMVQNYKDKNKAFRQLMHILDELYPHRCSNEKCNEELFIYDVINLYMEQGLTFKDFITNWQAPLVKLYCQKCYINQIKVH